MKDLLSAFFTSYQKSLDSEDFYEEPLGDDFVYPDW